jgi:hypothetical protein
MTLTLTKTKTKAKANDGVNLRSVTFGYLPISRVLVSSFKLTYQIRLVY